MNNLKEKFENLVRENIKRDGVGDLLAYLESTDFYTAPASTMFHCSYESGLVEHSINVFERLIRSEEAKKLYDIETLAVVSLFHDICKCNTYEVSERNVKDENGRWIKVPYYKSNEIFPYGHGEKSVYLIMKYMKLTDEEALAINWHMSSFDARVKGGSYALSGALTQSVLTLELHVADMRATYIDENKENIGKEVKC